MTFKLLGFSPHADDGTSVYRAWGVLPELRRITTTPGIEIINPGERFGWPDMRRVDAVFLQRAFTPQQLQIAHMAKEYRKPIVLDYDDNLFCVQKDNPTASVYNQPALQANIEQMAKMADAITVSTEGLRAVFLKFNPNVYVVPNALDMSILTRMSDDLPLNPIVCWRGGHTHTRDLFEHTEAILEAYAKYPQWAWAFVGYEPWWITQKMQSTRFRVLGFDANYPAYMRNLAKLRSAVQIVPLHDNIFNHSKSRIAHLESCFAGSTALVPAWPEWMGGECSRYNSPEEFRTELFRLLETPLEELRERNKRDWAWVQERFTLDKTNQLRLEVLQKHAGYGRL